MNTLYVNVYGSWEWTEVEFKRPNFDFPGMDSNFNLTVKSISQNHFRGSGEYSFWRLDSTSAFYGWLTRLLPCSWCRGTLRRTWWAWASTISSTPLPRRSSFLPWVTLANGDEWVLDTRAHLYSRPLPLLPNIFTSSLTNYVPPHGMVTSAAWFEDVKNWRIW